MRIDAETAVSHITVSMDNDNSNIWYDASEGVTWIVSQAHDDRIFFTFLLEDGTENTQEFRLVPVDTPE